MDASADGASAGSAVISYEDMLLERLSTDISSELLLCLSLWRFSISALEELGKAGPLPTKKTLSKAQQLNVQTKAWDALLLQLSSLEIPQLLALLQQFTQHSQLGDEWQLSGNFPNSGYYDKWHTQHHSHAAHIVDAIVAMLSRKDVQNIRVTQRLLIKMDGACLTFLDGSLRFGCGRTLKDELVTILKTNNKSVVALKKTLSNSKLNSDICLVKQNELSAILKSPLYRRTQAYYEEMRQQCREIEAIAKEGESFEGFLLNGGKCDTWSALIPLKGRLIVSHLDSSLNVSMEQSMDDLDMHFASECKDAVNAILQAQGKAPTYTFSPIKLVGDTRSKSKRELSSSSFEGVIRYWNVKCKGETYHARLKQKRDAMNHEPKDVSCVFTPGSPFTEEVYNTAMDAMLRERKEQRELEAYHAHKKLFSPVLDEIAKRAVHSDE